MAAGGGDGSTFLFDTNIESIVPRITQGLQGVQKAVNAASKGATTKLTSNLPRDLSRLAADAEQQMQKLEKALQGGKLKGTLGAGYGKIIADLNQKIGSLTQGRGLTLDVGIKFQEAALKQVLERAQRRLNEVENSTQAKVRNKRGANPVSNIADFNAGFNGDPAANKKFADETRKLADQAGKAARQAATLAAAEEKIATDTEAVAKAVGKGARAAKKTANAREREAKARETIADNAEKEARQSAAKPATKKRAAKKAAEPTPVEQVVTETPGPAAPVTAQASRTASEWIASTERSSRAQQRLASIVEAMAASSAAREARYLRDGAIPVKPVIPLGADVRRQREIGQRGDVSGSALDLPRMENEQIRILRGLLETLRQQATAARLQAAAMKRSTDAVTVTAVLWNQINREVQRILEASRRRAAIEAGDITRPRAITAGGQRAITARGEVPGSQLAPIQRPEQGVVPRAAGGALAPLTRVTARAFDIPRRLAIESGLDPQGRPLPDPVPPTRNRPGPPTPQQRNADNFRRLTNGLDDLLPGVKPINRDFVIDTNGNLKRIYKLVGGGFEEVERGSAEFFRQMRSFNRQQDRAARAAARAADEAASAGVGGFGGGRARRNPAGFTEEDRQRQRQNQQDVSSGRGDGELAEGVNPIGGPGSRFIADTRGAQTRILRQTRDGFEEIQRGTSEFEALARRLRAQQAGQGGGILNSFLSSFTSGSAFGGGNGTRPTLQGALEGLSKSAGTTAKYAVLGQTFYAIQQAAAAAGAEILDFSDSVTELNIALTGLGEGGKEAQVTTSTINQLSDSATLAGANVGEAMDQAASAIRAFKGDTDGTQASMERLGVRFSAAASQIKTITGGDLKDVSDNLKATALAFDTTDFSRVSDVIAGSKAVGGGAENDIQSGIAASAIAAKEAGFSLEETGVLISKIVAETSESGVLAATRFSKITAILGGSAGKSAIARLNQSLSPELQIDTKGSIAEQVKGLSAVYGDIDEAQRQQLVNSLGGTANARELIVLLQNAKTLTEQTDGGFTGKGAEEYQKRLVDIRAVLTNIQGEFKNIIAAFTNSGVFVPLFALIKEGLLPALDATRVILQTFNLIPKEIRYAAIAAGELYLVIKLIAAIGRTGVLGNMFGAFGRNARQNAAALEAQRTAAAGANTITPIVGGRRGAPVPLPAGPAPLPAFIPQGARIRDANGRVLQGREAEEARRAANAQTQATRRAASEAALNARRAEAARRAAPNTGFLGLRRNIPTPLSGVRNARAAFQGSALAERNRAIREARLAALAERNPAAAATVREAQERARQRAVRRELGGLRGVDPAEQRRLIAERTAQNEARDARRTAAQEFRNRLDATSDPAARRRLLNERIAANQAAAAERRAAAAAPRPAPPAPAPRTVRQRISEAGTRAGVGFRNTFGRGPEGAPSAAQRAGRGIASGFRAAGPEIGILAAVVVGTQIVQATTRINAAVKEFGKLSTLPTSFGVEDLNESAIRLKSAAHQLRGASGGFFGTIVNFVQGDRTGQEAKRLDAVAAVQENSARKLKAAQDEARRTGVGVSDTIDLSTTENTATSLQSLASAGADATTQFGALLGAMLALGDGSEQAATRLSALQKVEVGVETAGKFSEIFKQKQTEAQKFSQGREGKALSEGKIPSFGDTLGDTIDKNYTLGILPALRRQNNGVGRRLREATGGKEAEANFQLAQADVTAIGNGLGDITQTFLDGGGNALEKDGREQLKKMYIDWLLANQPDLNEAQRKDIAETAAGVAEAAVKGQQKTSNPAQLLLDTLSTYKEKAASAAQQGGVQAALGRGPAAELGQDLATSSSNLTALRVSRQILVAQKATPAQLKGIDADIAEAELAQRSAQSSYTDSKNNLALSKLSGSDASGRATLARKQADKKLREAGYDPETGKELQVDEETLSSPTGFLKDAVFTKTGRKVGAVESGKASGLNQQEKEAALAAKAEADRAEQEALLQDKISKRRSKIDPRDEIANAKADVKDANDQIKLLKDQGVTGAALTDAQANLTKAKQNAAQVELETSISQRNVNALPASTLDTATRNLKDGEDRLKLLKKGTIAYNQQLGQNIQAERELALVQADVASLNRQLAIDLTNPVQVANEAVTTAKDKLRIAKDTKIDTNDPDAVAAKAQLVATERINVRNAEANAETAAFSQFLSNSQTALDLGRISHQAYMSILRQRKDNIDAEIATLQDRDPQKQLLIDESNQLAKTLKGAADELSGQFNLGDIKVPTVYEVRRAVKEKVGGGGVLKNNAALSQNGNVVNDSSSQNVILNGVPIGKVLKLIEELFGKKASTRAKKRLP